MEEVTNMNSNRVEDDIQNVRLLCGQLQNIIKIPKMKKKNRGRGNMSMDDRLITKEKGNENEISPSKSKDKTKNKVRSIDTKFNQKQEKNTDPKSNVFNRLYIEATRKKMMLAKEKQEQEMKQVKEKEKPKKNVNINGMLNRFKDFQAEKNNKLQELKRKCQEQETSNCKAIPDINEHSKKIYTNTEDFFQRLEKYKETSDQKKKDLAEKEENKKLEEEKKILEEMNKNNKKVDKQALNDKINTMMEWENNRKNKINTLKEQETKKQIEKCTFKPELNKKSVKMASQKKELLGQQESTAERLYKQDVIKRKHKQEILQDIYAPSFSPIINGSSHLTTEVNYNERTNHKTNGLNMDYITNKENNMIEELLKERVRLARSKNVDN